jgi:hypothetical protein
MPSLKSALLPHIILRLWNKKLEALKLQVAMNRLFSFGPMRGRQLTQIKNKWVQVNSRGNKTNLGSIPISSARTDRFLFERKSARRTTLTGVQKTFLFFAFSAFCIGYPTHSINTHTGKFKGFNLASQPEVIRGSWETLPKNGQGKRGSGEKILWYTIKEIDCYWAVISSTI